MNLRSALGLTALVLFTSLLACGQANATVSNYSASEFSKFCAANPSICKKIDVDGKKAGLKCPDFNNQLTDQVFVHAGDGQKVYEMPHDGFKYAINLYGVGGASVSITTHQHDLSWVAVVCKPKNSPTLTPTLTCTPTPTLTPTVTPTSYEDQEGDPSPIITVTPTPTVTETPTPKPTQSESSNGGGGNSTSNDSGRGGAEVLGATTLAATGSFDIEGIKVIFFGSLALILQGLKIFLKK